MMFLNMMELQSSIINLFLGLISKSARILEVYLQSVASKDKAIVCIKMDV